MNLYFFNWPSPVGGADTKLAHLLRLLGPHYDITVVPNHPSQFAQPEWRAHIHACGARAALMEDLPPRLEGWAVSLCNGDFLKSGTLMEVRRRGLKIAWSSEMMWHFGRECAAAALGLIDALLYVSPVQRRRLEPRYLHALGHRAETANVLAAPGAVCGWLQSPDKSRSIRWVMAGNYIDPALFSFRQRGGWREEGRPFTAGRLSRPDPDKFPPDFPHACEALQLEAPARFRVMAWSEDLARRWPEYTFDDRWDLLPAASVPSAEFLDSLDIFVYDLGPRFAESWGRAVVEAMLCGAVPLIPADERHHLRQLFPHGTGGFHCYGPEDFGRYARMLQQDAALLGVMSLQARRRAEEHLCNAAEHLALWREIFTPSETPAGGRE